MRRLRFAMGALVPSLLLPGLVLAQRNYVVPEVQQPASVQKTAYQDDEYLYTAPAEPSTPSTSPSDQPAAPAATPNAAPPAAPADSADEGDEPEEKDTCRFCHDGTLGDPWELFPKRENGLKLGGWLEGGIFGNQWGARSNGPLGMTSIGDGFVINQTWFYAEKAIDTSEKTFDWGFRADYVFGTDGPWTQAFGNSPDGWDNDWNTSDQYGSAMPQLYGVLAMNDLSVKLGHFYTPMGYEVVPAGDNFFYSHSYTMVYGEPFTHTGALASYKVNDDVTVHGGWIAGWDTGFENPNGASMYCTGFTVPVGEKIKFTWLSSGGYNGLAMGDLYFNSFVFDVALTEKWKYVLQHDLGTISNQPGAEAQWYGINQYLFYQINDCWAVGGRFEWFHDDDGTRVVIGPNGGNAGDYYELSFGMNFKPHANFILRPELRYDWYNGNYGSGAAPFNDGIARTQFSGGFDFIFKY
jgi:hypothetical protein